jgi:hypothetical protein
MSSSLPRSQYCRVLRRLGFGDDVAGTGSHAVAKKVGPVIEKDDHIAASKNADRDLVANWIQKPDCAADQRGLSPGLRQQLEPHAVDVLGGLGWN